MRIAILILAFKNPGQLRKLVDVLKKEANVYIHFDKRSHIDIDFPEEDNVRVTQKRYPIYWGSMNAQLAALELLQDAYKDGSDYFIVISGQDLPLMSYSNLSAYLKENYYDYLYNFRLPGSWSGNGGLDRLNLFWENKYSEDTLLKKVLLFPQKALFRLVRLAQKKLNLIRPISFEAHGGSFCLNFTRESVAYILKFVKEHPWFTDRFKYTRCADEVFFQTILLGFDYERKDKIVNDDKRYQNWTKGPTYPRILTLEDYEDCINSDAFFARKFDEDRDSAIIDKMLERVR